MFSFVSISPQIFDEEESDRIVYDIRDDLMTRVMNECQKSYLKKQSIRFIVQCAYDAMVKFLCMNFYYHCGPPDIRDLVWTPDEPIEPSPKDSWAQSAVPIRKREFVKEEFTYDLEEFQEDIISRTTIQKTEPDSDLFECGCPYICDCLVTQAGIYKGPPSYDKPCPSKIKFSPKSSKGKIEEKIDDRVKSVLESGVFSEMGYTTISTTVDDPTGRDSLSEGLGTVFTTATKLDGDKKKHEKPILIEEKIEVPSAIERGSQANIVILPPIRINTKFTSKPDEYKKKRKN